MDSIERRFWSKVDKTSGCWLWTAGVTSRGYGKMSMGGRQQYAHRLAWYFTHGLLDANLVVDHKCHNTLCVNPDHLQLVTTSQNMQNRAGAAANSKSGVRGVHWHPQANKWRVQIRAGGRNHSGGMFTDLDAAAAAASALRASLMSNSLRDL